MNDERLTKRALEGKILDGIKGEDLEDLEGRSRRKENQMDIYLYFFFLKRWP